MTIIVYGPANHNRRSDPNWVHGEITAINKQGPVIFNLATRRKLLHSVRTLLATAAVSPLPKSDCSKVTELKQGVAKVGCLNFCAKPDTGCLNSRGYSLITERENSGVQPTQSRSVIRVLSPRKGSRTGPLQNTWAGCLNFAGFEYCDY